VCIKILINQISQTEHPKTAHKYKEHVALNISPDGGLGMCPLPPEAALP